MISLRSVRARQLVLSFAHQSVCLWRSVRGSRLSAGFQQAVQAEFQVYTSQQWHWNEDSVVEVQYATSNIAPDRPMIQVLVDDYCSSWDYAEEEEG